MKKNIGLISIVGLFIILIAGWVTHIVYCFQNAEYLLLIVGVFAAPIGSIHGMGLWFGFW